MGSDKKPGTFDGYFLRRKVVLLILGIAHAYLLWPGDILITYAMCGPMLLLFVHTSVRWLIVIGVLLKGIGLVFGEQHYLIT